jgi:hypothetical protein
MSKRETICPAIKKKADPSANRGQTEMGGVRRVAEYY